VGGNNNGQFSTITVGGVRMLAVLILKTVVEGSELMVAYA
jgi:hypothetical protein